jgi:hypothetical protein
VTKAGKNAESLLRKLSRSRFSEERISGLVSSAKTTQGVPMHEMEAEMLHDLVQNIKRVNEQLDVLNARLEKLVQEDSEMVLVASVVGPICTAAIAGSLGLPKEYASAHSFEKATGLNLKIRSSGESTGQLKITKRGPSNVRQLLYLAVLRLINTYPEMFAWYAARKSYQTDASKKKAIVALMRKLARALWHVSRGATFDVSKLFDLSKLTSRERTRPFSKKTPPNQGDFIRATASGLSRRSLEPSVRYGDFRTSLWRPDALTESPKAPGECGLGHHAQRS